MRIGELFRMARPYDAGPVAIDGLPNFFHVTVAPDGTLTTLDRGITGIAEIDAVDGPRRPAILIRSSPHKAGSEATPWADVFAPNEGHVRYWGDAKATDGHAPERVYGNRLLLDEVRVQQAREQSIRERATPILLFLAVPHAGRAKGQVRFQGVGVLRQAELRAQWDRRHGRTFANYVYDFVVLDLSAEDEDLDWSWINARRTPALSTAETLELAPRSWQRFVGRGQPALATLRRSVANLRTIRRQRQCPDPGSREDRTLTEIYRHYAEVGRHKFEALSELIVERIFHDAGSRYVRGWLTASTADGGADFIGRLDVGTGFATAKLVVLGQAKCEKPTSPTGGSHIARTVARLRRGWLGVYVTTSYFSESVQREIIEDRYPLMLVHGLQVAETVGAMMHDVGQRNVSAFLDSVDASYAERVKFRDPDEILLD